MNISKPFKLIKETEVPNTFMIIDEADEYEKMYELINSNTLQDTEREYFVMEIRYSLHPSISRIKKYTVEPKY
jgi:dsDNA-binding SOS-regulon protein